VQGQSVALGDLAGAVGEQGQVAVVQLADELLEDVDGFLDIRADEAGRAALPDGQLDQLGIEQRQLHRGVEGAHGDQELEHVALAGAGLAAQEQVALGQGHGDLRTVLILPHRDGLPQRQRARIDQRPGNRSRVGQRITAQDHHPGVAGTRRVADHPDLAHSQERGDPLGLGLQVGHLAAGWHPDPELLAGPGEPTADNPWDTVVDGDQLGMTTSQCPPPPQMGAEQSVRQRLPGPGDHRHDQGSGHDQPLRPLAAEPVTQPQVGAGHERDQGQLQPVGPGRAKDAVEQPLGRTLPHHRSRDNRRRLVQGTPADRLAPGRRPVRTPGVHDATPAMATRIGGLG
jgi:hypothetical protein